MAGPSEDDEYIFSIAPEAPGGINDKQGETTFIQ